MTSNPYADDSGAVIPGVPHRWTALTIALAAIGFVVFWPLGLAVIVYVVWGEKLAAWAGSSGGAFASVRKAADDLGREFRDGLSPKGFGAGARNTGNAAFDAWRAAELKRIHEARRKLDEITSAFEAHLRAERGGQSDDARQRDEFERFMASRGQAF